jgi:hypothetical protein
VVDITISSAQSEVTVEAVVAKLYDMKLRDFPAYTYGLFINGYSATSKDMDDPLWAFLDELSLTDQGILLVYLLDAIRTH